MADTEAIVGPIFDEIDKTIAKAGDDEEMIKKIVTLCDKGEKSL